MTLSIRSLTLFVASVLALPGVGGCASSSGKLAANEPTTQLSFQSPEDAVVALIEASRTGDVAAVRPIFGPGVSELESDSPDKTQGDLERLAAAYDRRHALFIDSSSLAADGSTSIDAVTLAVGEDLWEFPVPIVRVDATGSAPWRFDTATGVARVREARFASNEADAVDFLLACIPAQAQYRALGVTATPAYAQRFRSEPGTRNGLWWSDDLVPPVSPLGPMLDEAVAAGAAPVDPRTIRSYRGYRYRILTAAGPSASGGAGGAGPWLDSAGNLVGGFAFLAWPDRHGETGVRTFLVSMDGAVWWRDLGPQTEELVAQITTLDPSGEWTAVQ